MSGRMAADIESLVCELPYLRVCQVSRFSQESGRDVKGRAKTGILENGRGGDEIGLGSVIEGNDDRRGSCAGQGLGDRLTLPSLIFQPAHLALEIGHADYVTHIAGVGIAKSAPRQLQLVVHEVDDLVGDAHRLMGPSPSPRLRWSCAKF